MADNNNAQPPTCYVCLDDESLPGNPIRRDCGCRGTAGFAHVKCVVRTLEAKEEYSGRTGRWVSVLRSPPFLCNQCRQPFRSETYNQLKRASDALPPEPLVRQIPTLREILGDNSDEDGDDDEFDEGDDDDEFYDDETDEDDDDDEFDDIAFLTAAQRERRVWQQQHQEMVERMAREVNPFEVRRAAHPNFEMEARAAAIRLEARNRQARNHQQQQGQRLQAEFGTQVQPPLAFVDGLRDDRQGVRNRRPNRDAAHQPVHAQFEFQAQVRYIVDDRGVVRPEANARAARPQRDAAQRQARRHQRDPAHGLVDPEDPEVHDWMDVFSRYLAPVLKLGIIFIASAFVSMVLLSLFITWLESTFGTRSVLEVIFKVIAESRAANHARPVLAPLAKLAVATKPHFAKAIGWSWRIFVKAAWMSWTYVGKPFIDIVGALGGYIAWNLGGNLLVGIGVFLTLAKMAKIRARN